jgi:acyl-[acyl carrier protein]--UDP-N-acetylglucosamine O-acyltransferase
MAYKLIPSKVNILEGFKILNLNLIEGKTEVGNKILAK